MDANDLRWTCGIDGREACRGAHALSAYDQWIFAPESGAHPRQRLPHGRRFGVIETEHGLVGKRDGEEIGV
jgi:hypothetical protein